MWLFGRLRQLYYAALTQCFDLSSSPVYNLYNHCLITYMLCLERDANPSVAELWCFTSLSSSSQSRDRATLEWTAVEYAWYIGLRIGFHARCVILQFLSHFLLLCRLVCSWCLCGVFFFTFTSFSDYNIGLISTAICFWVVRRIHVMKWCFSKILLCWLYKYAVNRKKFVNCTIMRVVWFVWKIKPDIVECTMLKKRRASSYHGDKMHTKNQPPLESRCVVVYCTRIAC